MINSLLDTIQICNDADWGRALKKYCREKEEMMVTTY